MKSMSAVISAPESVFSAVTVIVQVFVSETVFGDGAEIVDSDEESGLYIVKATAEDKSVAYYVIKVEAAPSAPVGEGNPLGTDVEDEHILFTDVSEPDEGTGHYPERRRCHCSWRCRKPNQQRSRSARRQSQDRER